MDCNELCKGSIDRRGGKELHVSAEVVSARQTLGARSIGNPGLDGHPIADGVTCNTIANCHDRPGGFVTQNQGLLDNEIPDPALLVIMNIGPAHAHRCNSHDHLANSRLWFGTILEGPWDWPVRPVAEQRQVGWDRLRRVCDVDFGTLRRMTTGQ